MKVKCWLLGLIAAISVGASAQATIIIPTNLGKGADAELREEEANVGLVDGIARGGNRGGGTSTAAELSTRQVDGVTEGAANSNPTPPPNRVITNYHPTNDRSSVIMVKFDIGALPAANDSFWDNKQVNFRLHARSNNNIAGNRMWNVRPEFASVLQADRTPAMYDRVRFGIRGLEPGGVYVDDGASAERFDRVGNDWTASQYRYDWVEGTGSSATDLSGVTFYNAPGITPHCVVEGSCNDPNIANGDPNSVFQTLGKYDDFDSNTRLLDDSWHWPNETTSAGFTSSTTTPPNLAPGAAIDYEDPNGNLKQLLLDAKTAGRDTLTLMVYHTMDGTQTQPNVGIQGTTPTSFLNHNYVTVPKEFAATEIAQGLDNSTGMFSPKLLIFVPEPASASLLALGALALCGLTRRRK